MVAPKLLSAVAQTETTVLLTFDQPMKQDASFFNLVNYTVTPGHTVIVVAASNTDEALLTLGEGMLNGSSLTATVNAVLENALGEPMDGGFLSDAFTGLGIPPALASVVPTSDTTIRVTFDEPLQDNAALSDPDNYLLSIVSSGAIALSISQVVPEVTANPTYVDLTVNEMTDAADYQLTMGDSGGDIVDIPGTPLDTSDPSNTIDFVGTGTLPDVATAEVVGDRIRINFSEPMKKDAALTSPANYLFIPVTAGAAQLFFNEVVAPPAILNPTFVEIETSEMTDGATYDVVVNNGPGGPTDVSLNPISVTDTATFAGEGENPLVDLVVAVSKNRADVVFNEAMRNNLDINDPTRYTWDNGLVTLDVLEVTAQGVVKLSTNDQVPGVLYALTIDPI
jgi:hypothetical protein